MASKEIYIGRHYIKKEKWIAAINRLKIVVNKYDTTIYVEEALHRLVEIYYKIGLEQEAEKRILAEKQKKLQEEQREQELNAKLRREARKKKGRDIILGFTYFLFFTGFLLLLYKKRYAIQSLYQRWKINRLKEAEAKRKKQIILEKEEEKRRKEAEKQKVLEAELARQQKLQQEADELNKKLKAIEEEEKLKAKIEIEKQEKIRKEKERIKQLEDEALERRKKELQAQDEHGLKFAKTVKDMFVEDLKKLEEETKPKKKKATSAKKSTQKKKPKSSAKKSLNKESDDNNKKE